MARSGQVIVQTCYLNGHNNFLSPVADNSGAPLGHGCEVDTLVVVGHNNCIDNLTIRSNLVVQGHNNKLNSIRCSNIVDQGLNNKITQAQ